MLEAMTSGMDNVTVDIFDGLLVYYCIQKTRTRCRAVSARSVTTSSNCRWR